MFDFFSTRLTDTLDESQALIKICVIKKMIRKNNLKAMLSPYFQNNFLFEIFLNFLDSKNMFYDFGGMIYYEKYFWHDSKKNITISFIHEFIKNLDMLKDYTPAEIFAIAERLYNILYELIKEKNKNKLTKGVIDLQDVIKQNDSYKGINLVCTTSEARTFMRYKILQAIKSRPNIGDKRIAGWFSVDYRTVAKIRQKYHDKPDISYFDLRDKHRGPQPQPFRTIPANVFAELVEALAKKLPKDFNLKHATWSGQCIVDYLEKVHEITVTSGYIYNFLKKNGISSKKCTRISPLKNPDEEKKFREQTFLEICQEAYENNEIIIFGDETSCVQGYHRYGFAPIGWTPGTSFATASLHTGTSILSLLGPSGFCHFFKLDASFNAANFLVCLLKLHDAYPDKKFVLILDNCRVHHASLVSALIEGLKGNKEFNFLRLKWLPAYCPELNPCEYFNNYFKQYLRKIDCHKRQEIVKAADEFLTNLIRLEGVELEKLIISFFKSEKCRFIFDIYDKIYNKNQSIQKVG